MAGMVVGRCTRPPHVERRGIGDLGQPRRIPCLRVSITTLVLYAVLAVDLRGQRLLAVDGIELRGNVQLVLSGGGTCNVVESDTSYEERKQNHGAPMDIWRLDFSVHNGSGRWLDHLIARYEIESEWPECTNWDGPDAGALPQSVEWANSNGHIQESGRNVVAPGRTLTATHLFIVLRGDPQPRFSNWSMDFDFAAAPPPPGFGSAASVQQTVPVATPEQENIFWQSIVDSTDPADFESYLEQFPNGVFRSLAQNRLRAIAKTPQTDPAGAPPARPEPESARVSRPICDFDSNDKWFDCWYEMTSPADCYAWRPLEDWYGHPEWTGECVAGLANGPGELVVMARHPAEDYDVKVRHTGTFRDGKKHGAWVETYGRHNVSEGSFVDGRKHGRWRVTWPEDRDTSHGLMLEQYEHGERTEAWFPNR